MVEGNAGINHLLLAESSQLVGTQCVVEGVQERVLAPKLTDVDLQFLYGAIVPSRLACCRVSSAMPGENLSEGDVASRWNACRQFRWDGEEWRVLTPAMG